MALKGTVVAVMFSSRVRLSSVHDCTVSSHLRKRSPGVPLSCSPSILQLPQSKISLEVLSLRYEFLRHSAREQQKGTIRIFFSAHRRNLVRTWSSVCLVTNYRSAVAGAALATLDVNNFRPEVIGECAKSSQRKTDLQVVLVSPQIPGNTGCIARTCAAAAVRLHLVEPLGFEINSSKLKRAGLDYWPYVVVKVHSSWAEFLKYFQEQEGDKRLLGFTKKGTQVHTDVKYRPGDWLMFGSETDGIPDAALNECSNYKHGGGTVRIPIDETYVRCLNLSVAAGIGIYEALRQVGFSEDMLDTSSRHLGSNGIDQFQEDIFC